MNMTNILGTPASGSNVRYHLLCYWWNNTLVLFMNHCSQDQCKMYSLSVLSNYNSTMPSWLIGWTESLNLLFYTLHLTQIHLYPEIRTMQTYPLCTN